MFKFPSSRQTGFIVMILSRLENSEINLGYIKILTKILIIGIPQ